MRTQVGKAVSLIAKHNFPAIGPDLINQLVAPLSPKLGCYPTNAFILKTAHFIFAR